MKKGRRWVLAMFVCLNGELTSLLFLFLVHHGRSKCFGFNWFKRLWWWEIGIAATIRSGMLHKARHFLVFGES
jgi:hypothetical protein